MNAKGTATVKYTLDGKTYTIKVKVLVYKNPVASVKLTGVNGGASFHAKTAKMYSSWNDPIPLTKKVTSAKLNVKPADGWKLINISLYDQTSGLQKTISSSKNPLDSAVINWGTLDPTHTYQVTIRCRNTSNGAEQTVYYRIQGSNA